MSASLFSPAGPWFSRPWVCLPPQSSLPEPGWCLLHIGPRALECAFDLHAGACQLLDSGQHP